MCDIEFWLVMQVDANYRTVLNLIKQHYLKRVNRAVNRESQ